MWKFRHLFMNTASADGGEGGSGAGEGAQSAEGGNLLSTGASDDDGQQGQPGAGTGENDWLPEKYRVTDQDGKVDVLASSRKLAEAHTHLEKRMGAGDAPPKSVDEYAPSVEIEGFNWDEFKADPDSQNFLKGAHARGITNEQLSYILGEYSSNVTKLMAGADELDQQQAATTLRETWKTDAEFKENLGLAHRAFNALTDDADKERMGEIGNNPLVIRMLAKIGREMQEDTPAGTMDVATQESVRDLMNSPAYWDDKHADHEKVAAQVKAAYQKAFGNQAVA